MMLPSKGGVVEKLVPSVELKNLPRAFPAVLDIDYLDELLVYALENKCSDLILQAYEPVIVQWSGSVHRLQTRHLAEQELKNLIQKMTGDPTADTKVFNAEPWDFRYAVKIDRSSSHGFRVNVTSIWSRGKRCLELVFRPVNDEVVPLEQLGVESYITENFEHSSGLVIVTGPTGSGKTTLLESMARRILMTEPARRVLVYGDPLEADLSMLEGKKGMVSQMQIGPGGQGGNIRSWGEAGRNYLRRHPDVLIFGEGRDRESIEAAIQGAQSSHLSFLTSHISNVHMTFSRMADLFTGDDRVRVINALTDTIKLIVHQRLEKRANGHGRVALRSALVITEDMREDLVRAPIERVRLLLREFTKTHGITLLRSAQEQFERGNISERALQMVEREERAADR